MTGSSFDDTGEAPEPSRRLHIFCAECANHFKENVSDDLPLPKLLHGQEQRVYGDSAYASQKALIRDKAPKTRDSPISVRAVRAKLTR